MSKIWPTCSEEAFRSNVKTQGTLFDLLNDPVMQEALLIIQSKLNATLPSTMKAATPYLLTGHSRPTPGIHGSPGICGPP